MNVILLDTIYYSWSPEGSLIVAANGENGNQPTAPIINRDGWNDEMCLIGHTAPVEVAVRKFGTVFDLDRSY